MPGHYHSGPDSSVYNNWSTSPNVNPYTGQTGTRNPAIIMPTPPAPPMPTTYPNAAASSVNGDEADAGGRDVE